MLRWESNPLRTFFFVCYPESTKDLAQRRIFFRADHSTTTLGIGTYKFEKRQFSALTIELHGAERAPALGLEPRTSPLTVECMLYGLGYVPSWRGGSRTH